MSSQSNRWVAATVGPAARRLMPHALVSDATRSIFGKHSPRRSRRRRCPGPRPEARPDKSGRTRRSREWTIQRIPGESPPAERPPFRETQAFRAPLSDWSIERRSKSIVHTTRRLLQRSIRKWVARNGGQRDAAGDHRHYSGRAQELCQQRILHSKSVNRCWIHRR